MKIAARILIGVTSMTVMLAGCTTPAEQAAQAERDVDRMVQIYGPACQKLGFKTGTDPWRNCLIGLSQRDAAATPNAFYGPPYWRY